MKRRYFLFGNPFRYGTKLLLGDVLIFASFGGLEIPKHVNEDISGGIDFSCLKYTDSIIVVKQHVFLV